MKELRDFWIGIVIVLAVSGLIGVLWRVSCVLLKRYGLWFF